MISDGLKFCNSCGAKLTREIEDKDGTPGKMLDNILTTLFLIVMFGMGILVGLVAVLLSSGIKTEVVAAIVLAYLATIFGICFSLARQVPKLIDARLKGWSNDSGTRSLQEPPPRTTAQLEEFRQPVASVTDHTTRTLDKVPRIGG
jgi:hypothetical protein